MEVKKEKERHAALVKQLSSQIADMKELQKAFEVSIGRKDEVLVSMPPLEWDSAGSQWKYSPENYWLSCSCKAERETKCTALLVGQV